MRLSVAALVFSLLPVSAAWRDPLLEWQLRHPPATAQFRDLIGVVYSAGRFFSFGTAPWESNARLFESPNGIIWTNREIPGLQVVRGLLVDELNTTLLAGSGPVSYLTPYGRRITQSHGFLLRSPDRLTWETAYTGPANSGLFHLARREGVFIAVGSTPGGMGLILRSTNGNDWTAVTPPGVESVFDIVATPAGFYAVTLAGNVLSSTDGLAWANQNIASSVLTSIAYGNGILVVSSEGHLLTSTNGTTWSGMANEFGLFTDVAEGQGIFVAPGHYKTSGAKYVWYWDSHLDRTGVIPLNVAAAPYGVGFGSGTFILAGGQETILQSGDIETLRFTEVRRTAPPKLLLRFPPGSVIELESSADLITWTAAGTLTTATGAASVPAGTHPGEHPLFYRSRLLAQP